MRMLTIRRAVLLGLLVLGVVAVGCTAPGDEARLRRHEAQVALAGRAGMMMGDGPHGFGAPAASAPGSTAEASGANDPVKLGQQSATQYGCTACHSINGSAGVGPTWKGLAGSKRALASGDAVTADDAYLLESIVDPNAKIAKGSNANIMPATFGTQLKAEDIEHIVAYINSLK